MDVQVEVKEKRVQRRNPDTVVIIECDKMRQQGETSGCASSYTTQRSINEIDSSINPSIATIQKRELKPDYQSISFVNTNPKSDPSSNQNSILVKEESVMLLQTPAQEQVYTQHVIVPDGASVKRVKSKKPASTQSDSVSYTVPGYDPAIEYKELDPNTLSRHYGEVTPYGTYARSISSDSYRKYNTLDSEELHSGSGFRSPGAESVAKSDTSDFSNNFSASLYSSVLRTSKSGTQKVGLDGGALSYLDFLPRKTKGSCCKKRYLTFRDCLEQANSWLESTPPAHVIRCETIRHRLNNSYQFNPESTTSHDRSYIMGLRIWYNLSKQEIYKPLSKLEYRNFIPRYLDPSLERTNIKPQDCPYFEDFKKTLMQINEQLEQSPLPGKLIGVETVPVNYAHALRGGGILDVDVTYCSLEFQGHWDFFIIRIYYLVDDIMPITTNVLPPLECHDFVPSPVALPPSKPQFQTMTSLLNQANKWLKRHPANEVISIDTVELPFKIKMLMTSKGYINNNIMCYEPARSSSNWSTLRVLRLWTYNKPNVLSAECTSVEANGQKENSELGLLTFVPRQLTTAGCCGAQKPIFATTKDTVERINEWIKRTGAEVVDIQTDNIEKWRGSSVLAHDFLTERTYNKEDRNSKVVRTTLEYRITVFRIYFRPKSLAYQPLDTPDKPVRPCCCFVGCTVM